MHPIEPPSLLVTDPPDHTRYRKLVSRVFTVRAVENLRDRTQQIATALLDQLPDHEPVDLIAAYCSLLPVTVIAEILGVPQADRDRVLAFGTRPDRRRQGIGTALLRYAIDEARAAGCWQVRSHSPGGYRSDHRLKFRLGFAFHPEVRGGDDRAGHFILPLRPILPSSPG